MFIVFLIYYSNVFAELQPLVHSNALRLGLINKSTSGLGDIIVLINDGKSYEFPRINAGGNRVWCSQAAIEIDPKCGELSETLGLLAIGKKVRVIVIPIDGSQAWWCKGEYTLRDCCNLNLKS